MKIKSLLVTAVLATAILCSAGFVSAQTAPTQAQLTQQLIQVLTQLIAQLEQEIATITAQHAATTSTQNTINGTCGSAQGQTIVPTPTANLCTTGTASAVSNNTGLGYWLWSCQGANGGTTANCNASN